MEDVLAVWDAIYFCTPPAYCAGCAGRVVAIYLEMVITLELRHDQTANEDSLEGRCRLRKGVAKHLASFTFRPELVNRAACHSVVITQRHDSLPVKCSNWAIMIVSGGRVCFSIGRGSQHT